MPQQQIDNEIHPSAWIYISFNTLPLLEIFEMICPVQIACVSKNAIAYKSITHLCFKNQNEYKVSHP